MCFLPVLASALLLLLSSRATRDVGGKEEKHYESSLYLGVKRVHSFFAWTVLSADTGNDPNILGGHK